MLFAIGSPLVRGDLVVGFSKTIRIYDEQTGTLLASTTNSFTGETLTSVTIGPDNNIYGPQNYGGPGSVIEFDARTANVVKEFVPYNGTLSISETNLLTHPTVAQFGPNADLYVGSATFAGSRIFQYDGITGTLKRKFVTDSAVYSSIFAFGPDANCYLLCQSKNHDAIARFKTDTAEFLGIFATLPEPAGSGAVQSLQFGKDGNIYLLKKNVYRVNGKTGAFEGMFIDTSAVGMPAPLRMAIGPDGDIYLAVAGEFTDIWRFDAISGASKGVFIHEPRPASENKWISGITFSPARLRIIPTGQTLTLRWPQSCGPYRLQSRTAVDQTWRDMIGSSRVEGGEFRVETSWQSNQQFFRLVRQ